MKPVRSPANDRSPGNTPEDPTLAKPPEEPTLAKPPEDQTLVKPPEDQTLVKPPEDQTLVKPPEDQTLVKPPEDQTLVKPPEDQTLVKPPEDQTLVKPPDDQTLVKPPEDQTLAWSPGTKDAAAAASRQPPSAGADDVKPFGDYDLLSVIAKGGMGVVYKARQRRLNRIVAIKMILAGQFADSTDVSRFYAEAEAAANLRHPNIVGIYEIGEVEGQHFFSMEFIEGQSLSEVARDKPLAYTQAAQYAKVIAEAMQFAHEHGILHRDLKPSNVLLDSAGQLLITDFGLAKKVESQSELTMTGAIVGTPSYMPPEQARGEIDQVDATSDVYSTGAILYELLTGVPPFRGVNPIETIRQVLDSDPAAPRLLNPNIPKDLETICLKTLQKERAARYPSEQELTDELGRFLAGEPIRARPIGQVARAWRWCRRNPVVASLSAAALLFLILALVGTSLGLVRATIARREAERSFRDSRNTVDEMFTRVSEDHLLNQPGMQPLRQDLLRRALAYYQKFLQQRGADTSVRGELANTYFRIGWITAEIESPKKALDFYGKALRFQLELARTAPTAALQSELGDTWNAMGTAWTKMRDVKSARNAYQNAIEIRRHLSSQAPDDGNLGRELANSLMNLGILQDVAGERDAAREQMQEAQQIRHQRLDEGDPRLRRDYAQGFYQLARLEWLAEDYAAAAARLDDAEQQFQALLAESPHDLWNQWRLASCLRLHADLIASQLGADALQPPADGQPSPYQSTLDRYTSARDLLEKLSLRNPDVVDYRNALAGVYLNLGALQQQFAKTTEALDSFQRAADLLQEIVDSPNAEVKHRRDLAMARVELSVQLGLLRRAEEAQQQAALALSMLEQLSDESSTADRYVEELARATQIQQWIESLTMPKQ